VVEDSNFNVVSYNFTDGTSTLNNLNSTASIFAFATPIGNLQNTPPFPGAQPCSNWFLSVVGLGANAGSIHWDFPSTSGVGFYSQNLGGQYFCGHGE
jgi:hypothetical protein